MPTLFGIKNCDTVKKARAWLAAQDLSYRFHDFRIDGLDADTINQWLTKITEEQLINRRSTTWKQLSDSEKALFSGSSLSAQALALLIRQPTLIKRPVLAINEQIIIGFNVADYSKSLVNWRLT